MTTKINALLALKERVQAQGTTQGRYLDTFGGRKCYCAVGHLLSIQGMADEQIARLEGRQIGLVLTDGMYKSSMTAQRLLIDEGGFTAEELERLQDLNDAAPTFIVTRWIDDWIAAEKKTEGAMRHDQPA